MNIIEHIETINTHLRLLTEELMKLEGYDDYEIILDKIDYQLLSQKYPTKIYSIKVKVSKAIERKNNDEEII